MAIHPTVLILVVSLSSLSLAVDVETFVKMQTTFEIWGSWSSCSGLCGIQGTRYRTRGCHHWIMGFMRFSTECPMYGRETQTCQVVCLQSKTTTSSAGDWGPWGQYSACDKTCGGGLRIRYRACRIGSCVGDSLQSSLCNAQHCPDTVTATLKEIVSTSQTPHVNSPTIGTPAMSPNATISSTSQSLRQRTCKVCGDYGNGVPCDIRSIYIGPNVECETGKDFCMTDITSDGSGKEKVFKRCVNETVCRTQWLSQTSEQKHCFQFGKVVVNDAYSCHFCCTSDECNQGLLPDSNTLYTRS